MIRLIDTKATRAIEIEGTTFNIKNLTNGEKSTLAAQTQKIQETESGYNELLVSISLYVKSIDGFTATDDCTVADFIVRIESVKSQMELIAAIIESASLNEDELKNSDSLSDLSPSPMGPSAIATNVTPASVFEKVEH